MKIEESERQLLDGLKADEKETAEKDMYRVLSKLEQTRLSDVAFEKKEEKENEEEQEERRKRRKRKKKTRLCVRTHHQDRADVSN